MGAVFSLERYLLLGFLDDLEETANSIFAAFKQLNMPGFFQVEFYVGYLPEDSVDSDTITEFFSSKGVTVTLVDPVPNRK